MRPVKLVIVSVAALALSACVVAPYPRDAAYYPAYGGEVVTDVAPPAPYAEVVPAMPYAGAVWISGYWGWGGGRYAWVPGRWDHGRPGYVWSPHRWDNRGGHWTLHQGGWVRR